MDFATIIVIIPFAVLLFYSIFNVVSRKTKTRLDDDVTEVLGEILEGLGKPRPENKEDKKD